MPSPPLLRYLAPFGVFIALSCAPGSAFGWLYAVKLLAPLLLMAWLFRGHWQEIAGGFDMRAVAVGLSVLALWLANYHWFYDAPADVAAPAPLDIAVKLLGSSIAIPIIEELFFRSFLMRALIKNDFLSVPLGSYTAFSFWASALAFAAMHHPWQWGAALAAGAMYGAYLVKTKNLRGAILAHAVTNFGLALYVLATGEWALWM